MIGSNIDCAAAIPIEAATMEYFNIVIVTNQCCEHQWERSHLMMHEQRADASKVTERRGKFGLTGSTYQKSDHSDFSIDYTIVGVHRNKKVLFSCYTNT